MRVEAIKATKIINSTVNNRQSSEDGCPYHTNTKTYIVDRDPFDILSALTFGDKGACVNFELGNNNTDQKLLDAVKQRAFVDVGFNNENFDDNSSLCFPFRRQFVECVKWKLDPTEYTLTENGTLLYMTSVHTESYPLGMYKVTSSDDSAHICIPAEDLPENVSTEIAIFCLWILSLLCLLILLVTCPLIRSWRSSALWPLMFHAACLFVRYSMIALFQVVENPSRHFCVGVALTVQISFISANAWLNVMNFDMWRQFRDKGFNGFEPYSFWKFLLQALYAWGLPTAVVGISIGLGKACLPPVKGYKERCLLTFYGNSAQIISIFGGIGMFVLINIILVVLTFINLCQKIDVLAKVNQGIRQQIISTNLKLLILSGFTWLLVIVVRLNVSYELPAAISTVIEFIMALQGIFLLAIYASAPSTRNKLKSIC